MCGRAGTEGTALFARYADAPNALGYCGPPEGIGTPEQAEIRASARRFSGVWPYLQVLARLIGTADPLDARLVEAYWLGRDLGRRPRGVRPGAPGRARAEGGRYWTHLTPDLLAEAAPDHGFHVFGVYPWSRLSSVGPQPLFVLDSCRIRWGTVVALDPLTVSSPRLTWDGTALGLGEPTAARSKETGWRWARWWRCTGTASSTGSPRTKQRRWRRARRRGWRPRTRACPPRRAAVEPQRGHLPATQSRQGHIAAMLGPGRSGPGEPQRGHPAATQSRQGHLAAMSGRAGELGATPPAARLSAGRHVAVGGAPGRSRPRPSRARSAAERRVVLAVGLEQHVQLGEPAGDQPRVGPGVVHGVGEQDGACAAGPASAASSASATVSAKCDVGQPAGRHAQQLVEQPRGRHRRRRAA